MCKTGLLKLLGIIAFLGIFTISCKYTEKIRDGRSAMDLKQYAVAVRLFEQEYNQEKVLANQASIAYELGLAHLALRQFDEAQRWFKVAHDRNFGPASTVQYARTLMNAERYREAGALFLEAGNLQGDQNQYRAEINTARIAAGWKDQQANNPYKIRSLEINTPFYDYAPSLAGPGRILFTSDRTQSLGNAYFKMTGNKFSSIYQADLFTNFVERFDHVFNSSYNDASLSFSPSGKMAVFVRCGTDSKSDDYCQLFYSVDDLGIWSDPILAEFTTSEANYRTPSFSDDGRLLIFAADLPGGRGGFDLYVSEYFQGIWQEPQGLPTPINTESDEISPFMIGDTLYFASDRIGGMGGLDIYRSFMDDTGKWSPPFNLMAPINSGMDDFGFIIDTLTKRENSLQIGYFVSNRPGGKGLDDIYFFELTKDKLLDKDPSLEVEEELDSVFVFLELITQEKEFNIQDDPNSGLKFRKPLGNVNLSILVNGAVVDSAISNNIGNYSRKVARGIQLEIRGNKDTYIGSNFVLNTSTESFTRLESDTTIQARILLEKIYYGKEIVLDNIYYDFDRWDIREDAKPALDSLLNILRVNPSMKIKLGSHTDCRGSEEYNQELSQKRAESAVNYLLGRGIDSGRLQAVGYGESVPVVNCVCETCTEEEHQLNRRTTFAIIR